MPARPLPRDRAVAIVAAVQKAVDEGFTPYGVDTHSGKVAAIAKAAGDLDMNSNTVRSQVRPGGIFERAYSLKVDWETGAPIRAARGELGFKPVLPGYEIKTVASRTEDGEWVKQGKAPGPVFEMPEGHVVKGVSTLVDGAGRTIASWIKTREDQVQANLIDAIREVFEGYRGRAEPIPAPDHCDASLMSVYPIADLHVGALCWSGDAGEDYDLKIAGERLRACTARLVAQSPSSKHALILNLGDLTHQDSSTNMTPRSGHILDVDGRYSKVLQTAVRLMMDVIDLALAKHEAVTFRGIPGNHDPHASLAITIALACFYANNPRVTIDDSPSEWFFHRFGKTLIGAHHGHRAKPADMAMTMACRCPEDWAIAKYRHFYSGHIHHERAAEIGNVRWESFQTIASKDSYAAGNGFVSGQSLVGITFHEEHGEIGRHRVNIPPPTVAATKVAA